MLFQASDDQHGDVSRVNSPFRWRFQQCCDCDGSASVPARNLARKTPRLLLTMTLTVMRTPRLPKSCLANAHVSHGCRQNAVQLDIMGLGTDVVEHAGDMKAYHKAH